MSLLCANGWQTTAGELVQFHWSQQAHLLTYGIYYGYFATQAQVSSCDRMYSPESVKYLLWGPLQQVCCPVPAVTAPLPAL